MQVRNDVEQHRLLSEIERMHREGRSETEIVSRMKEMGGRLSRVRRRGQADDDVRTN